eukprot:4193028-Heterocapsa_arctica.AAC.1
MSALMIAGEIHKDIVVPIFPGFLIPPLDNLGFVPNLVVVRATLPRLSPPGSQTRLLCKCPDGRSPNRRHIAQW